MSEFIFRRFKTYTNFAIVDTALDVTEFILRKK